jgi:hypothetical protein
MPLCLPYIGLAVALGSLSSVALSSTVSPASVAQADFQLQLVMLNRRSNNPSSPVAWTILAANAWTILAAI